MSEPKKIPIRGEGELVVKMKVDAEMVIAGTVQMDLVFGIPTVNGEFLREHLRNGDIIVIHRLKAEVEQE
jgi:hypothetical protein